MSLRALVLGVLLLAINAYWIMDGLMWGQTRPTTVSLFVNVVFTLFCLNVLNWVLKLVAPKWRLRESELVCLYALLSIGSAMCSLDFMQPLVSIVAHLKWHAGVGNNWDTLILPHVPSFLMVTDKAALKDFYAGHSSLYAAQNYHAWLRSVLIWSGFIFVLVWAMVSLCVLLRREWTEKARLSYPIAQPPYEMIREDRPLFGSRLFWAGFLLAATMNFVNGMSLLYPTLPSLGGVRFDIGPLFTARPWNAIGWTPLSILPFGIGLGFLIPLDLAFSCWFFYWFWKAEKVVAALTGWWGIPRFPYIEEQQFGGYMGLCLSSLWVSRNHLAKAIRLATCWHINISAYDCDYDYDHDYEHEHKHGHKHGHKHKHEHKHEHKHGYDKGYDAKEPMRYRFAVWSVFLCFCLLVSFSLHCGMSWWVALVFFLLYYCLSIAITRLRAELGSPVHDLHLGGPHLTLVYCLGTRILSPKDLTLLSFFQFFNRAYRGHVMPHQLESFKLAELLRTHSGSVLWAMTLGMLAGTMAGFWALLHVSYLYGGRPWYGSESFSRLATWLGQPTGFSTGSTIAVGLGLVQGLALSALRMRYPWFPLHAAGFAVSGNWSMNLFWLSIFFAWVIKRSLLNYVGLRAYRDALPLFIGLILGDYVVGSGWSIWGCIRKRPAYNFLP